MKKQNKRNQFTRMALALLLILSMLGNTLIFPTVAQETVAPVDNTTSSETPSADEATTDATLTPTLPEPIQLTAADIPEFISAAALQERGAVERMRSEETNMSSVIFRNSDGTRTMYMYGLPVKYTSADGTVRDKSTNLVSVSTASVLLSDQPVAQTMAQMSLVQQEALQAELGILDVERAAGTLHMLSTALTARQRSLSDMAYTTLDNDVYALFPTNLAKGMTLVFGEHSVRMTPAGTGMTVTAGGNVTKTTTSSLSDVDVAERLLYPNVFGLGTAVQYTPTLTGVKEEILLSRNVGKNSFAFLLETGGLVLAEQSGQFILIDPETEQQVGKLGEIIVFDSAGQVVRGNMTAQTILAGQKYGITISVDAAFLASATYPVSIDPTIITSNGATSRMIEDMGIYNHEDAWMWTFEDHPYVGKTGVGDFLAMLAYRFPFIYNDDHLPFDTNDNETTEKDDVLTTAAQIGSATLVLQVLDSSSYPVTLNAKASVVSWSQNGMRICDEDTYDAALAGPNTIASSVTPEYSSEWSLDITEIMRAWYNHENGITHGTNLDPEKGLLLYCDSTTTQVLLGSVDSSHSYNHPYLLVNYITEEQVGPYYINNKESHEFLLCTDPYTMSLQAGLVADLGTSMEWMLYYVGSNKYALSPADYEGISFINSAGTISIATFDPEPYCQWSMITDDTSSNTNSDIVFRNVEVEDRVFSYIESSGQVGYTTLSTSITDISHSAITDHSKWRLVRKDQYVEFPSLPPTTTAISPDDSFDVHDFLNTSSYSLVSPSDIIICIDNESAATTSEGRIFPVVPGVVIAANITHLPTGNTISITLHIGTIAEGTYVIESNQSREYLTGVNNCEMNNSNVIIMPFDLSEQQKWEVDLLSDGYYSIALVADDGTLYYMTAVYDSAEMAYLAVLQDCVINSTSDEGKWRIQYAANGGYCLIPKSYEAEGLVLINPIGTNLSLEGGTASEFSAWRFYQCKYVYYVKHYYDQGFELRFADLNVNTENLILSYQNEVAERFLRIFNIEVIAEYSDFVSPGDTCKILAYEGVDLSNISKPCEHSPTHLTPDTLRASLQDGTNIESIAIWTGHIQENNARSNSRYYDHSIVITPWFEEYVTNLSDEANLIFSLLHELSHQINAYDHYCYGVGASGKCSNSRCDVCRNAYSKPRSCVMSYLYNIGTLTDENLYCSDCQRDIRLELNHHH